MNNILDTNQLIDGIRGMQIVDLSHTIEEGMPVYPTHPQFFHMRWHTGDPANLYQLLISEHAGTHLDCPAHFYGDRADPHCVSLESVPIELFIGRAVKLNFPDLEGNRQLTAGDIQAWEASNQHLKEGDAVVFHFGWDRKWNTLPEGKPFLESWPGITGECARYLADRRIRMAATDCLGIDGSATTDLGAHFALLENGILIVENLRNLDKVPSVFFLITLPLKIKDGTGCPIRAVAIFSES